MTPEEILAECPEKFEKRYFVFSDGDLFTQGDTHKSAIECLLDLAQSRKEARELRGQVQHFQGQLNYFTGGPVNG